MGAKWHNIKVVLRYCEGVDQPIVEPQWPMFFDLGSDPGENYNLVDFKLDMGWMFALTLIPISEYEKSIAEYPNIVPGADFDGYPASPPEGASH